MRFRKSQIDETKFLEFVLYFICQILENIFSSVDKEYEFLENFTVDVNCFKFPQSSVNKVFLRYVFWMIIFFDD